MQKSLDEVELRVLGCLIEKQLATPAYYPLSLNSLVSACNQKSNREPVVDYPEDMVELGLGGLMDKGLASRIRSSESRVDKYGHLVYEALDILPQETAIMAELMLRGAQTPGELKQRASRMAPFDTLEDVHSALDSLMEQGLVLRHERRPGRKERRYSHLLSVEADGAAPEPAPAESAPVVEASAGSGLEERVISLEQEVRRLRQELDELKRSG